MNRNKQVRAWLEMGIGRATALAKTLNVSRQFISKISVMEKGISQSQWNAISYGISIIELDEQAVQRRSSKSLSGLHTCVTARIVK